MTSPIWLSYSRRMKARGRQFWKPFRTSTLPDASLRQSTRSAIRMSAHVPDRSKAPFIRKSEGCQTSMSASRRLRPCIGRCRGAQTTSNSQDGGCVARPACRERRATMLLPAPWPRPAAWLWPWPTRRSAAALVAEQSRISPLCALHLRRGKAAAIGRGRKILEPRLHPGDSVVVPLLDD
jgi:hypothetical protein